MEIKLPKHVQGPLLDEPKMYVIQLKTTEDQVICATAVDWIQETLGSYAAIPVERCWDVVRQVHGKSDYLDLSVRMTKDTGETKFKLARETGLAALVHCACGRMVALRLEED